MKKPTKKKSAARNRSKTKSRISSGAAPLAVDQDIVGLLTVLVQKLTAFESKLDMVFRYVSATPAPLAASQAIPVMPHALPQSVPVKQSKPVRPLYQAVCADCSKNCEVPFKPQEGRPVYCKECFAKRKAKNGARSSGVVKTAEPLSPKPIAAPIAVSSKATEVKNAKPKKTAKKQKAAKVPAKKKSSVKKAAKK